jgi:replicative DNA helicase
MSAEQFAGRLLALEGGVDMAKLRDGFLVKEQLRRVVQAGASLCKLPFYVDDSAASTLWEIRARARAFASKHTKALIIIDYLQLIRGLSMKNRNRYQEIGEISRGLKALAREVNAPVMVLSQLSRDAEQYSDGYRMLSTLRESGDIEQDADVAIILHRPPKSAGENLENVVVATVAKHRNGPTGKTPLLFDKKQQRFLPASRPTGQDPPRNPAPKRAGTPARQEPPKFYKTQEEVPSPPEQYDLSTVDGGDDDLPF